MIETGPVYMSVAGKAEGKRQMDSSGSRWGLGGLFENTAMNFGYSESWIAFKLSEW